MLCHGVFRGCFWEKHDTQACLQMLFRYTWESPKGFVPFEDQSITKNYDLNVTQPQNSPRISHAVLHKPFSQVKSLFRAGGWLFSYRKAEAKAPKAHWVGTKSLSQYLFSIPSTILLHKCIFFLKRTNKKGRNPQFSGADYFYHPFEGVKRTRKELKIFQFIFLLRRQIAIRELSIYSECHFGLSSRVCTCDICVCVCVVCSKG